MSPASKLLGTLCFCVALSGGFFASKEQDVAEHFVPDEPATRRRLNVESHPSGVLDRQLHSVARRYSIVVIDEVFGVAVEVPAHKWNASEEWPCDVGLDRDLPPPGSADAGNYFGWYGGGPTLRPGQIAKTI